MAEAMIFDAIRTPRGRGKSSGALYDIKPVNLLAGALNALAERHGLDTSQVDDVVIGCVSPIGEQGACIGKTAALAAGWDWKAAGFQLNRFCGSGLEAVNLIKELAPDLVFLDVQMPGLTGLDVARRLVERDTTSDVIFVTAFDERAIEAFEVNAVDYLLKPVDARRLEQALARARRRRGQEPPLAGQLDRLVRLISEQKGRREQVAVKTNGRFVLIQADDIIYASLVEDSITIVTGQVAGTSNDRTLDELHARLDPSVFWRVHRSHLVNINKVKEIVPWFSRNYILRMMDAKATEIPVSRSQTRRLRDYLKL